MAPNTSQVAFLGPEKHFHSLVKEDKKKVSKSSHLYTLTSKFLSFLLKNNHPELSEAASSLLFCFQIIRLIEFSGFGR